MNSIKDKKILHIYNRCIMCQSPIVFFVEDTKKEGEYEVLLRSIFKQLSNNFKVFSMDGKVGVIEIYNLIKHASIKKKKFFYLVDGDFDILKSDYSVICNNYCNHFCFLERYDIENYLIDFEQINNYLRINCNATNDDLLNSINFAEWENRAKDYFGSLFLLFFALFQFKSVYSNCCLPETVDKYKELSLDNDGMPSLKSISWCRRNIVNEFIKLNSNFDEIEFENCINRYEKELSKVFSVNILNNVSGKYLIHSLVQYIKKLRDECSMFEYSNLKCGIDYNELRKFLISHVEVNKFKFLYSKWNSDIHNIIYA